MKHQDSTPDDILTALKIKLVGVEKKLHPAEDRCDELQYERDTLKATISLLSKGSRMQKARDDTNV